MKESQTMKPSNEARYGNLFVGQILRVALQLHLPVTNEKGIVDSLALDLWNEFDAQGLAYAGGRNKETQQPHFQIFEKVLGGDSSSKSLVDPPRLTSVSFSGENIPKASRVKILMERRHNKNN